MAQETGSTYSVSPKDAGGDFHWQVTRGGNVVARGQAATQVQARVDAIRSVFDDHESMGCSRDTKLPTAPVGTITPGTST